MTVLELLVVLVIMSMVGVVATIQITQQFDRAKVDVASLQLKQLQGDLELFKIDTHRYPTSDEGLDALLQNTGVDNWRGPYVKASSQFSDPWGGKIGYRLDSDGKFTLTSLGADRKAGGDGAAADLTASS